MTNQLVDSGLIAGTWTLDSAHTTVGFTARHLMSKVHGIGELGHPQPPILALRQHDEDLVLGPVDAERPQVGLDPLLEQRAAQQIGPPDLLLLVGQPSGIGRGGHVAMVCRAAGGPREYPPGPACC